MWLRDNCAGNAGFPPMSWITCSQAAAMSSSFAPGTIILRPCASAVAEMRPDFRSLSRSIFIARGGGASADHPECLPDLGERRDRRLELRDLVRRADLHADARLALRHDRVAEADHVHALGQHLLAHLHG